MAQQGPPQPAALAAGAQQPLPAIGAAQPPPPRTFAELFASMPDAYHGEYQGLFNPVRPDPAMGAMAAQTYICHLFPSEEVPSVWLYQARDTGRLQTLIIPHVVRGVAGPADPWVGMTMAFTSDIFYGQIAPIRFPVGLCDNTPAVRAPTVATMTAAIAANPGPYLGPYGANDPGTEELFTRSLIPVPHAYIPLVLFRSLTPGEAWLQLGESIIQDQREADCSELLDFLRVAAVRPEPPAAVAAAGAGAAAQNQPPDAAAPIAPAVAGGAAVPALPPFTLAPADMLPLAPDAVLMGHIRRRYLSYLPALAIPDAPHQLTQQLLQSTIVLRDVVQGAAIAHQAQAGVAAQAPPKTFTEAYPGMAAGLRKLCGAGDDDAALPMFWVTFAASGGKKNQCRALLDTLVHERALEPDSAQVHQVVSNECFEEVYNLRLGSKDPENLTLGLTPFLICPRGYHKANSKQEKGKLYATIHSEGFQATISDIRELLTPDINLPDTPYQLVDFVGAYSILIDVLIGKENPLAVAVREHFVFWRGAVSEVVAAISYESAAAQTAFTVGVMRSIQTEVVQNISDRANPHLLEVELPDFQFIVRAIRRRTFGTMPGLPAHYYGALSSASPVEVPAAPGPACQGAPTEPSPRTAGANVTASESQIVQAWHTRLTESGKTIQLLKALGTAARPTSGD
jgi:hypothetical protein